MWSMGAGRGAPSFYSTLESYTTKFESVVLITGNNTIGLDIFGIKIIKFNVSLLLSCNEIRILGAISRVLYVALLTIFAVFKFSKLKQELQLLPDDTLIYGYEIHGVPATYLIRLIWGFKSAHRFQGTVVNQLKTKRFWKLRGWDHYIGLSLPCDIAIMANDGTQGNIILSELNTESKQLFLVNGLASNVIKLIDENDSARRLGNGVVNLVAVSRLVEWKRVDRLFDILQLIRQKNKNVILNVVGDGPHANVLATIVETKKLTKFVKFHGALKHESVINLVKSCDIFISAYELSNLGNPLLEALCIGLPVVTFNNGGTDTVITSGINGMLVVEDDLQSFSNAVLEIINNVDKFELLSKNAKIYAKSNFKSWPDRIEFEIGEILKLYV